VFSSSDILEMDSVISSFDIFENQEAGLLILAWAVFLCLAVSLPGKEEHNELMVSLAIKNVLAVLPYG